MGSACVEYESSDAPKWQVRASRSGRRRHGESFSFACNKESGCGVSAE